jgi:hypothetical protein
MSAEDLRKVRTSMVLALFMASAGALALLASARFADEAGRDHRTARAAHDDAQRLLASARAEETEIAQKIDRFRQLARRGAIGAEQRLAWVELIGKVRAERRLAALDYEFSPQRPLDASLAPAEAGAFDVMSSALHVRLPLLHEGDLLALLHDLDHNAPALTRVRECSIVRRASTRADAPALTLQADCLIDWITFRPRAGASS